MRSYVKTIFVLRALAGAVNDAGRHPLKEELARALGITACTGTCETWRMPPLLLGKGWGVCFSLVTIQLNTSSVRDHRGNLEWTNGLTILQNIHGLSTRT